MSQTKRKKAEPSGKPVSNLSMRKALVQGKPETKTYRDYANEFIDLCHSKAGYDERQRFLQQKLVSEVEHQAKIKEMQEEFNSYCAKTQANCNHCAVKHTEKIEVLEGENTKLREELVRQNAKLAKMALRFDKAECVIADLRERLEAIRQWREKYKDKPVGVWAMSELGVLLASGEKKPWPEWLRKAIDELPEESEPKELDQKTREGDIK